jgi:RNA polymerase sigma-70 factor (ECF subfamily)
MPALTWNLFIDSKDVPSEANLLIELREGSNDAYREIVKRFTPRLLATARRFLTSEDDCHEAVQEAFISAFKSFGSFQGQSQLGTWLHRIVVNACLMNLRKQLRHPETPIDDLLPGSEFQDSPGAAMLADHIGVDHLEREETQNWVHQSIALLPHAHQEIIHLRDIEELSTEAVADRLGITSGAVKTRLHRARQALKSILQPHYEEMLAC